MKHKKSVTALLLTVLLALPAGSATIYDRIDKNHSTIGFSVSIMGGLSKVRGKFTDFDVKIDYDEEDITQSSVRATIRAASINTGIEDRDRDLRGPNFFDVEKYPEITFQSTRIEKRGDVYVAVGTFFLRGVTQELAMPFAITGRTVHQDGSSNLGVASSITLNRQEYGITWQHNLVDNFVGDEVEIELFLKTRRSKAD